MEVDNVTQLYNQVIEVQKVVILVEELNAYMKRIIVLNDEVLDIFNNWNSHKQVKELKKLEDEYKTINNKAKKIVHSRLFKSNIMKYDDNHEYYSLYLKFWDDNQTVLKKIREYLDFSYAIPCITNHFFDYSNKF